MDMTEQVEAIERRNAEFNRALSDYYTRHQTWPACCGDCEQGRKVCVTPEACQICDDYTERDGAAIRWIAAGLLLTWAVIAAAAIAAFS